MPGKIRKSNAESVEAQPDRIQYAKMQQQRIMVQLDLEYLRTDVRSANVDLLCARYLADQIHLAVEAGFATPDLDKIRADFDRLDMSGTVARIQGLTRQWKGQDKALQFLKAAFGGADEELSLIAQERVQLQHQAIDCIDGLKAMVKDRAKLLVVAIPLRAHATPARLASCNPHMTSTPDAGAPLSPQAARDSPPGSPAISPIQPPVRGAYKEPSPARDASDPNPDPSPPGSPAISPIKLPVQAVRNKPRLEYSGNDKPNESVPGSPAISPIPARKQPSPLRHGASSHATVPKLGEKRPCPDDEAIDNQAPKNKKAARVDRKRLRLEEKAMPAPKPKVKAPARIGRRSPDENDNDKDHAGSDNCHKPQAPAQLNTSASALDTSANKGGKKRKLFANKFSMAFLEQAKKTSDPTQRILGNLTLGAILAAKSK